MHAKGLQSNVGHAKRLTELGAAFAAYRRSAPRRPFSGELRGQAVAALAAGVPVSAICRVCHLSWGQITEWREAGASAEVRSGQAGAIGPVAGEVRMLSVVDPGPAEAVTRGGEIEVRIGGWWVSFSRAAE